MSGLIIGGEIVRVPWLNVRNWFDDARLRIRDGDRRARDTSWVRSILYHMTRADPLVVTVRPGRGPSTGGIFKVCNAWGTDVDTHAGSHLVVDWDGTIACCADLQTEAAYHATTINDVSIGIEIYQDSDGSVYDWQMRTATLLGIVLAQRFGIWRQTQYPYVGEIDRLAAGGNDCVGMFGHRDQTSDRGPGDPGDQIYQYLRQYGTESFDFSQGADVIEWKNRQTAMNQVLREQGLDEIDVDGVPGPATVAAYKQIKWLMPLPGDPT